jgi:diguanylate cyclase (GGDEF)-like protein
VVRYGGEEFLLVLPEVSLAEAHRIAERARAAVETTPFAAVSSSVTISLGIAEHLPGESVDALLARADEALYRAKKAGRNRVEVAA